MRKQKWWVLHWKLTGWHRRCYLHFLSEKSASGCFINPSSHKTHANDNNRNHFQGRQIEILENVWQWGITANPGKLCSWVYLKNRRLRIWRENFPKGASGQRLNNNEKLYCCATFKGKIEKGKFGEKCSETAGHL